ncbi:MAG: radical SAM protein [Clostridia bacterium]|nr:radical SAM protein [Clostridia bacterium]
MLELLENCELCPRKCGVNRLENKLGFCGAGNDIRVARASLHKWEEPCLSGTNGSGTVFFSYCTLKCVFCQNYNLSHENFGKEITIEKLSDIFLTLQEKKAHNINLVTPTHYIPQIIEAIKMSRKNGLTLPIVYNSSGFENPEIIKLLSGYIDIYLPDFKYFDNTLAKKYSLANNYFEYATKSIEEMLKQVGEPKFDGDILKRGVIIRHLILPGFTEDSKKILKYLYENYKDKVYISIMNQYTPIHKNLTNYSEIDKKLTEKEYDEVIDYAISLGIENAFIQEGETAKESFIPDFDLSGI